MKRLIALLFFLAVSSTAFAGFNEGLAAHQKGDYATAMKEWLPLAEQGNVDAQRALGYMYEYGTGVKEDARVAMQWFLKAAAQGDATAQNSLGGMYEGQNAGEAVRWYSKAAEQGYAAAQYNLGRIYWLGLGVEKNLDKAEQLFTLAVKQGNTPSKECLDELLDERKCLKTSTTKLFGEALLCTDQDALRKAAKRAGAVPIQEDDSHWYDTYDSSKLLEGTSQLSIGYIDGKFAEAIYQYDSNMDLHKVVDVRDMVISKYGKPEYSSGNPSLGEVSYAWKLGDGITSSKPYGGLWVRVERGWPDTTVFLKYRYLNNVEAMEAEMAKQSETSQAETRSKQTNAF